jgi:hypothetical protein
MFVDSLYRLRRIANNVQKQGPPSLSGPPYPPTTQSLGGVPDILPDIPPCVVFLVLYAMLFVTHVSILKRNNARSHKFVFNGALFGKYTNTILGLFSYQKPSLPNVSFQLYSGDNNVLEDSLGNASNERQSSYFSSDFRLRGNHHSVHHELVLRPTDSSIAASALGMVDTVPNPSSGRTSLSNPQLVYADRSCGSTILHPRS